MTKKGKTKGYNYYKEFMVVSNLIVKASNMLNEILHDHDLKNTDKKLAKLHEIERSADEQKHAMMNYLFSDFLPPIEREDIIDLASALDTVIDMIEDILRYIDMFQVPEITPEMLEFMEIIEKSALKMHDAVKELKNFKKPKALQETIIEINRYENLGDELYLESVKKLYIEKNDSLNPLDTVALIRIYDYFEKSCDSFEEAAEIISRIILKNS